MQVDFEHRSPRSDDVIRLGMVDLEDGLRWIDLDESRAWCWQQGCMLQWRPGSETEIMWNDREGEHFVGRILDVRTGVKRTLPIPFYTVSPDGLTALSTDFRRIQDMRPGYGYPGVTDPNKDVFAPKDSGIYKLSCDSGEYELVLTIDQIVHDIVSPNVKKETKHYFNHLLFNTDGSRFTFLHRWRNSNRSLSTRMITASPNGNDVRVIDDYGHTSHFVWRDKQHILAWSWHPSNGPGFYLYQDGSPDVMAVGGGIMTSNGHCSYLPGTEWILNDTYPDTDHRNQQLYLYQDSSRDIRVIGQFHSPNLYSGEWRCDLHPRYSPDGHYVVFDSTHEGYGRQMYIVDVRDITNSF